MVYPQMNLLYSPNMLLQQSSSWQLMATPTFQFLRSKILMSLLSFFLPQTQFQAIYNSVGSIFKIYPELNHFQHLLLLAPPSSITSCLQTISRIEPLSTPPLLLMLPGCYYLLSGLLHWLPLWSSYIYSQPRSGPLKNNSDYVIHFVQNPPKAS